MKQEKRAPLHEVHYRPKLIDLLPVAGFFPHVNRIRKYMKGIREGEYAFPSNAPYETAMRFAITAYHGILGGLAIAHLSTTSIENLLK